MTRPAPSPEPVIRENAGFSNVGAGRVPTGETAARPPAPADGYVFYNQTISRLEMYDSVAVDWVQYTTQAALDAAIAALPGIDLMKKVKYASTGPGTLATDFEVGDAFDGGVLALNDRILLKDQVAGAENGLYTVNATGAPTRATDANSESELVSAIVVVSSGTANHDKVFMCTNDTITVDTTALTFIVLPDITAAVAAEAALRTTADTTEATARAAADTSEASTRATADTTNATAITAEAATRATADTTLAASVTTEATARAAADTTLAAADATEAAARAAADTADAIAWAAADAAIPTVGRLLARTRLTSGTAATFTRQALTAKLFARAWGGGGGGGGASATAAQCGAAGGGAAGGYADKFYTGLSGVTGITYTVGALGAKGAAGANAGSAGGNTLWDEAAVIGTMITAKGQAGGAAGAASAVAAINLGGSGALVALNGDTNAGGMPGGAGRAYSATLGESGTGGSSSIGNGGAPKQTEGAGVAALGLASGGGGALTLGTSDRAGGDGTGGYLEVWEWA